MPPKDKKVVKTAFKQGLAAKDILPVSIKNPPRESKPLRRPQEVVTENKSKFFQQYQSLDEWPGDEVTLFYQRWPGTSISDSVQTKSTNKQRTSSSQSTSNPPPRNHQLNGPVPKTSLTLKNHSKYFKSPKGKKHPLSSKNANDSRKKIKRNSKRATRKTKVAWKTSQRKLNIVFRIIFV